MYTVKEVAELLKLKLETVRTKLRKGEIKGKKLGKAWRITKENLDEYINKGV